MTPLFKPKLLPGEGILPCTILMSWPHENTDWCYMLDEVRQCFVEIAVAIAKTDKLLIVTPEPDAVAAQLAHIPCNRLTIAKVDTNDTWARDFGPITVFDEDNMARYLDFRFNGWGLKFAADKDNLINRMLAAQNRLDATLVNSLDMVLEGGSIESDGKGTLMTTSHCLLSPNRNGGWDRQRIEQELADRLGVKKIIWLNHGALDGDDTDSHIDTLARFAPDNKILYCLPDEDDNDAQAISLRLMAKELSEVTNVDGLPFTLMPLPVPAPIFDEDGERLPATYANFLVLREQVLVPIYNQPERDEQAMAIIGRAFPGREVVGIDCRPLIRQHGSLHCVTMQIYT